VKQDFLHNKPLLIAIILVLFVILIILTIIAFTPTDNLPIKNTNSTQKSPDLCQPFLNNPAKISCPEAVKTAVANTKGQVKKIAIGLLELSPEVQKNLKGRYDNLQVWLIDIELAKPLTAPNGNKVKSVRIQIPTDGTGTIYRMPINS